MELTALVLEEREDSYNGAKGVVKNWTASVRDMGKGVRCTNNLTYFLSPEETDKFKGKLRDNMVRIQVVEIRQGFSGDFRLKGQIELVKPA